MNNLSELIAKVEALTAPDRDVDFALYQMELGSQFHLDRLLPHWTPEQRDNIITHYTASLEAVVALLGRLLPAYCWQVRRAIQCEAIVWALEIDYDDHEVPAGTHPDNPAIALIAALLKALRSPNG